MIDMRNLLTCLAAIILFTAFYSCQKELSLEFGTPASGTLQSSAGDCLPKTVAGSYIANKAINDSNFIEVTVNVLTLGSYTIYTDSVNGYAFKATGAFTTTGSNTVRLKGSGRPVSPGVDNFTVIFDSSFCSVAVTVLPSGSSGGPAAFTLAGAPGGCTAFDLGSVTYYKDTTLDGRHVVKLNVNVTTVGSYSITTNTVNGYFFSTSGTFGATGTTQVTLQGSGKPLAAGTNNFTVTAGGSTCTFSVVVTAVAPPAGSCTVSSLQGVYTAGTATTATNKVVVTHTYAAAGNVSVSTGVVNGYSFGPANISATVGLNTITLNATGTPSAAGTNTFTITFGDGQTCTFTVTVIAAPGVNSDYFPLSASSYWTYVFPAVAPTDTIKKINNATATGGGNTYRVFEVFDNGGLSDHDEYYRRSGNDYFEYNIGDAYSQLTFDTNVEGDILFLKEGLTLNQAWTSAEFTGTVSGAARKLRYTFKCIDPNATVTVNGKSYSNVYKVTMQPEVSTNGGTTWTAESLIWESWFAKGVGLVQQKGTLGANSFTTSLRFYQVF
jgi:hypothetical protein